MTTPPGVRCFAQAFIEARALPVRLLGADLQSAVQLAEAAPHPRWKHLRPEDVSRLVHRVTRHPVQMRRRRCMRTGLLGYRFLRRAGYAPVLHFAIAPDSLSESATRAHCWVTLNGRAVINDPDPDMVEIYAYPSGVTA